MKLPQINTVIFTKEGVQITKDTPIAVIEEYGKECTQCGKCCSIDSGMVLEEDIPRLAAFLGMTVDEVKKRYLDENPKFNTHIYKLKQIKQVNKAYGKCVLFDEKRGCTVHPAKPTHCRLCSTKSRHGEQLAIWFILRYLVNPHDAESVRQYAQYLQTHPTIPGGELEKLVPDKEMLRKILSYEIFR